MKSILIYSLALAALTSCSKSEEAITPDNPNNPLPPKEIHISAAIEASAQTKATTRADATPLKGPIDGTADIPGIQFLHKDATTSEMSGEVLSFDDATLITGTRIATGTATTGGSITFSGSAPQYDQKDNKNAYFVAYYPEATEVSSNVATLTIDGKTDILYAERYDAGSYTSITTNTMTFKHALAQIKVICKGAADATQGVIDEVWGKITKIEIETKAKATYTYATQKFAYAVSATGGATSDKLALLGSDYNALAANGVQIPAATAAIPTSGSNDEGVIAAGMFAPDDEASSTAAVKLIITTQKDSESAVENNVDVQLMNGVTQAAFISGKTHTVTLTFNSKEKNITVTGTKVEEWTPGYTGTGSVTPKENDSSQGS